ncbi:MAG: hypothetical protein QM528_00930 [Phycisphaerales bacterium]|nr:hypothetical protein [Phycisphaerales bacterium]
MKNKYVVFFTVGVILVFVIYFMPTVVSVHTANNQASSPSIDQEDSIAFNKIMNEDTKVILVDSKKLCNAHQLEKLNELEQALNKVDTSYDEATKISILEDLSQYWRDSIGIIEPYLYYQGLVALADHSGQKMNQVVQAMVNNLIVADQLVTQQWLATQVLYILDRYQALAGQNNDSAIVNRGACFMFGNVSNNPMSGILSIRNLVVKDSNNLYAQYMLGLGSKKSGQIDKAINRFLFVAQRQPHNVEVVLLLAECYDMQHNNSQSLFWYTKAKALLRSNQSVVEQIDDKITELSKS